MVTNDIIRNAMTVRLEAVCDRLPPEPQFAPGIRRAPCAASASRGRTPSSR